MFKVSLASIMLSSKILAGKGVKETAEDESSGANEEKLPHKQVVKSGLSIIFAEIAEKQ